MQGPLWISLLRRIPPAKHSTLVVVTTTGTELMVQRIFRLEDDYIVLRARLAGSSDQGRIILLPYDSLNSVAFNGILPENEVEAMFGDGQGLIAPPETQTEGAAPAEDKPPESAAEAPPAFEPPPRPGTPVPGREPTPAPTAAPAVKISKSVLLARLRARLSAQPSSKA